MTIDQLKEKIEEFYHQIKSYRELLSQSRDSTVQIVRNRDEINQNRSELSKKYGALSKYIKNIGNYPLRSDVGGGPYPVYVTALSTDILQRRGPCIDAVIQDLEYILGRLESLSEEEFDFIMNPRRPEEKTSNPHREYWTMLWKQVWGWIKNHTSQIFIGVVIIVIGTIIVAWLGLNK